MNIIFFQRTNVAAIYSKHHVSDAFKFLRSSIRCFVAVVSLFVIDCPFKMLKLLFFLSILSISFPSIKAIESFFGSPPKEQQYGYQTKWFRQRVINPILSFRILKTCFHHVLFLG
jgi:hypothetical protein